MTSAARPPASLSPLQSRPRSSAPFIGRTLRRIAITAAGTAVIAAGIAMLVLPGPGLVTIALGLSLLGREHAWAAALEQRIRARVAAAARRVRHPHVTALPPATTTAPLDEDLEAAA